MVRRLLCASFLHLFLLAVLVPSTGNALPTQVAPVTERLRCQCVQVMSGFIPFRSIDSVQFISPGAHCTVSEVIATLKNGRKICLDPNTRWVKLLFNHIKEKANH